MRENLDKLRRVVGAGAVVFAMATVGLVVAAAPAQAIGTDWYVSTTGNDSNACTTAAHPCKTVSEVVFNRAENNDIVHVASGTYPETQIGIDYNLTIEGATNGTTTISESGEAIFAVFGTNTRNGAFAPTVTFKNLNISGNAQGLGVLAVTADVHIVDSHVDNNAAGGVLAANAAVEASNSTFNGNGDPKNSNPLFGSGMLVLEGAATVDHSTFDANHGGGVVAFPINIFPNGVTNIRADAANNQPASIALDHSTVSNNEFGGVFGIASSIQVTTSTVSGNTAVGIDNAGGVADVENSTVTGTKAEPVSKTKAVVKAFGAGIVSEEVSIGLAPSNRSLRAVATRIQKFAPKSVASSSPRIAKQIKAAAFPTDLTNGQTAISGSIVASQDGVPDCQSDTAKSVVDEGYNNSSDSANSCGFSAAKHDLVKIDPLLGPLRHNGGPTQTHLLKKGSPAIDFVPAGKAGCDKSATDQRDLPRVQPVGGKCDIGAVELAAKPLAIHPASLPHGTVGKAYSKQITATGGQYPSYTFKLESGSLPPGLTFATSGKISGTPTKKGTFTFTVSVNDPVLKTYTIVIDAAAKAPISDTGSHTGSMLTLGAGAVLAGFLVLLGAGLIGRRPGRHRGPA